MNQGDRTRVALHYSVHAAPKQSLERDMTRLRPVMEAMSDAMVQPEPSAYGFMRLPTDEEGITAYESFAARYTDVDLMIVVGIGGANLGALAVQEALLGAQYNNLITHGGIPKILFADTIEPHHIRDIVLIFKRYLARSARVLLVAVSKSGTTTETIANFELLLETMRRSYIRDEPFEESVVVITEIDSPLAKVATSAGFALIPHPKDVGGRYSVLSCVGLFPLAVLGVDIRALCAGAADMRLRCLLPDENNPAAMAASITHAQHKAGRHISNYFIFAPDYEAVGRWRRQLVAESLGKETNAKGTAVVNMGITPTFSIGTTDLHSIGQLALAGPYDTFTTFVKVESSVDTRVPFLHAFDQLLPHIQGKEFSMIYDAVYQGTLKAYKDAKRPYVELILPDRTAFSLGQLLQFEMMHTVFLAKLFDVNPFDQPAVESYKNNARKTLEEF